MDAPASLFRAKAVSPKGDEIPLKLVKKPGNNNNNYNIHSNLIYVP